MNRVTVGVGTLGIFVFAVSMVSAQAPQGRAGGRGAAPPEPTNLQVLPKDMTRQQVVPIMQNFNAALGVGCEYCHVRETDAPGRVDDFAADTKLPKRVARTMMLMTRDVNSKLGTEISKPANERTQVGCVTCHRGVAIPKQLVDIVLETSTAKNVPAALDQYRALRKQYHGAAAYDFSDFTLFSAAQRAIAAMKPDDALAYLQANLEFHPNSARSYQQMSVAYQRKNDTANAIAMLEKAIALDPKNAGFQNQLNQLKNPQPAAR